MWMSRIRSPPPGPPGLAPGSLATVALAQRGLPSSRSNPWYRPRHPSGPGLERSVAATTVGVRARCSPRTPHDRFAPPGSDAHLFAQIAPFPKKDTCSLKVTRSHPGHTPFWRVRGRGRRGRWVCSPKARRARPRCETVAGTAASRPPARSRKRPPSCSTQPTQRPFLDWCGRFALGRRGGVSERALRLGTLQISTLNTMRLEGRMEQRAGISLL